MTETLTGETEAPRLTLILRAATIEFATHGYSGASIQSIAVRAGVAKGLIFHHYKNKKQLYLTALRQAYDDLLLTVEPHLCSEISFLEMLVGSAKAKVAFFIENPNSYHLIFNSVQQPDAVVAREAREIYQKQYLEAQRIMAKNIGTLPLREGVSHEEALSIILAVMENVQHILMNQLEKMPMDFLFSQADELQDLFFRRLDLVFYGILGEKIDN